MQVQIRSYDFQKDFLRVLNFDGRSSRSRAVKLELVKFFPEVYYAFITEDEDGIVVGFVTVEDRGDKNHYIPQINVS